MQPPGKLFYSVIVPKGMAGAVDKLNFISLPKNNGASSWNSLRQSHRFTSSAVQSIKQTRN